MSTRAAAKAAGASPGAAVHVTVPYPGKVRSKAGLIVHHGDIRAVDVRDPFQPKEVGYFIPAITEKTDKRCVKVDGGERCKTAIQTNNVEVDNRGFIYIVDRANTGMHVLRATGKLAAIAGR